uniref:Peptidase S1 domain-containing protein n=1 Tax=Heliothis virescens TaxID=7102 RepID=A0A2A4JZJ1_HELVI
MKTKILIALCFALTLCVEVNAEGEQEVRRGLFPYMAFLYYPDESVVDGTGARFLRGAVLIRPDWLVTSAVGPSILTDGPNGFPRKTLLARLGAVTIDSNFTLNEDEDEQEREVIQIVRPYNHSATQWWRTDISLMKVLLAFNMSSAVGITNLSPKREYAEKSCIILVYAKNFGNRTDERNLIQLTVELLPPSIQNCGSHFIGNTMTCASDSDDNKNAVYDENFCQGNSGGPLICENEVVGIQTYIDNDCKQPHLYQLLSAWDNFITCGTEDKCHEDQCSHICDVANKDPPAAIAATASTVDTRLMETTTSAVPMVTSAVPTKEESEPVTVPPTTTAMPEDATTEMPASRETTTYAVTESDVTETKSWPNEKYSNERKKLEQGDLENTDRKPSVEAQHHDVKLKVRSAGRSNVSNTLTLFFGFFILACLI